MTAWLASIDKGIVVDRSTQTVAELMRYWLQEHARQHVRAKTYGDYEGTIRVHIIPALGSISVQKLTPDQLKTFYSARDRKSTRLNPVT